MTEVEKDKFCDSRMAHLMESIGGQRKIVDEFGCVLVDASDVARQLRDNFDCWAALVGAFDKDSEGEKFADPLVERVRMCLDGNIAAIMKLYTLIAEQSDRAVKMK